MRTTQPADTSTVAIHTVAIQTAAIHTGRPAFQVPSGPALLLTLFLLLALTAAGCGSGRGTASADADNGDQTLNVVTTIAQLADVAEIVGGEHVDVTGLMGPGSDPHLYVATEGDVTRLQEAEIIFYNGLFLEAQMVDIMEQLGERKPVVAVGERVDKERLLPWEDYEDQFDPHIWFDVTLWMETVRAIRDTYSEVDPAHADAYAANAEALLAEMEELHAYVQEQAQRLPEDQRILVTGHDAFAYFGAAYGFEVRGLQGISTESEAGAADVRELANFIAEEEIPAIFIETSLPPRNVEALQDAVAAQGFEVAIGGELYSDAMGDPDTPEGTYMGMVRYNIDTIVTALLADDREVE